MQELPLDDETMIMGVRCVAGHQGCITTFDFTLDLFPDLVLRAAPIKKMGLGHNTKMNMTICFQLTTSMISWPHFSATNIKPN